MEFRGVFIITLLSCVLGTYAASFEVAVCPEVTPMANFDMDSLVGTWYEYKHYDEAPEEKQEDCDVQTIEKKNETDYEIVETSKSPKGTITATYTLRLKDPTLSPPNGHLTVSNVKLNNRVISQGFDNIVVETDYKNFVVSWTCHSYIIVKIEGVSVITRTRTISQELEDKIDNIIREKIHIDPAKLKKNIQEDCEV